MFSLELRAYSTNFHQKRYLIFAYFIPTSSPNCLVEFGYMKIIIESIDAIKFEPENAAEEAILKYWEDKYLVMMVGPHLVGVQTLAEIKKHQ